MRRMLSGIGLSIFLLLIVSSIASAQMQSAEYHQALADKFEAKAKVYENYIAEHERMVKGYQSSYRTYDSQQWNDDSFPSLELLLNRTENHCNEIIKAATSLREDMLEFTKLHKMKAAALQQGDKPKERG